MNTLSLLEFQTNQPTFLFTLKHLSFEAFLFISRTLQLCLYDLKLRNLRVELQQQQQLSNPSACNTNR